MRYFGEIEPETGEPLDPTLPSLDEPITIHLHMSVLGRSDAPEAGSLVVDGGYFGYVFEPDPVPEPGSDLLVMTGLLGLAFR